MSKDILAMEQFVTEANRQPSKRRKRKSSQSNNAGGNVKVEPGSKKNRSPGPQSFNPMPGVSYFIFKMFKSTKLLEDNMKKASENNLPSFCDEFFDCRMLWWWENQH